MLKLCSWCQCLYSIAFRNDQTRKKTSHLPNRTPNARRNRRFTTPTPTPVDSAGGRPSQTSHGSARHGRPGPPRRRRRRRRRGEGERRGGDHEGSHGATYESWSQPRVVSKRSQAPSQDKATDRKSRRIGTTIAMETWLLPATCREFRSSQP